MRDGMVGMGDGGVGWCECCGCDVFMMVGGWLKWVGIVEWVIDGEMGVEVEDGYKSGSWV